MKKISSLLIRLLKPSRIILLGLLALMLYATSAQAQFVRAQGNKIVDPNGNEILLKGMNLGNWLLWEGYLMMGDFNYRTHTQFFNSVKDAFGGDLAKAMEFEHQWRLNYVTEYAIGELKGLGFNSVRVPFHFNMFWDWNSNSVSDRGFEYIDRLIDYCRIHGVYILLDMHAAPGYQNPGDHCDNGESNASQPRESVHFWDGNNVNIASQIWRHIANRYKNEPMIWGYDLINEPVPQPGREFELLGSLITMRNAIRQVDNNHVIVAEGSWWGSDMQKLDWMDSETQSKTGINYRWDNNLVYQTHHYSSDVSLLNSRLAICNKLNVPLILGEYGESDNTNLRNMTDWCINNNVGYFPWSFKKMSHDRCMWTIPPNTAYNQLKSYINYGGTPPANIYNNMIAFCNNNIANGAPGLIWHQGFYDAIKFNGPIGCDNANAVNLPAIIQAENYCNMYGIQSEPCSEGGENIGYVDANDWAEFKVNVPVSGIYTINFRVAADGTGPKSIQLKAGSTTATANFTATGGWQVWSTKSTSINLNSGSQTIRVIFPVSGLNLNWIELKRIPVLTTIQLSPLTATLNVGQTQQFTAIGYDQNGAVMAISPSWSGTSSSGLFTATTAGTFTVTASQSGISRSASVTVNNVNTGIAIPGIIQAVNYTKMSGIQTENCSEGGQNVGWIDTGDWMDYTVNVTSAGAYNVRFRVAAGGAASKTVQLQASNTSATATFKATGGWQVWTNATTTINLNAGSQNLRVYASSAGFNINYIELTKIANSNPFSLKVEAENSVQMSGIQTENTTDIGGGQNVGYIDAGDWMSYNVTIPSSGIYTIEYRVASQNGGGQIRLEQFGGSPVLGTIAVTSTSGWQNWTTLSHTVQLSAGSQSIAIAAASGGFNINWFNITSGTLKSGAVNAVETLSNHSIKIYPNPAVHEITIEVADENPNLQVGIYSIAGNLVSTHVLKERITTLPIEHLTKGMYLVSISNKVYKIIKQ